MQQSTSQVIRCSNISHHALTLSSNCLEPSKLGVSWSSSSERNVVDASGRSVSATVAFSATYPESLQGDHLMRLYEECDSANSAGGNLATTVVTLMTTRNKFMWVHLLVWMINSCNHNVSCQHLNHIYIVCLWALQNVFLMWMDSNGTCGYNLIDEFFIIKNDTFCNNYAF